MNQNVRTFVAVEIPENVARKVARFMETLAQSEESVRWVDSKNLHITIKFLGDVPATELHEVCRAVEEAAIAQPSFTMLLSGTGAFPSLDRPRTVWLGADEGAEDLTQLAASVDRALQWRGFPPENRAFHPHLTLGRLRRGRRIGHGLIDLLGENAQREFGIVPVEELVIFSSDLGRGGPVHEAIGRAPLGR